MSFEIPESVQRQFEAYVNEEPQDLGGDEMTEEDVAEFVKQPSLFDEQAGIEARDAAMRRVDQHADPDWKTRAQTVAQHVARTQATFTADDLWAHIEKPREPRALGPVMKRLVKEGFAEPTGRHIPSRIPEHHRCPLREYRSLVFEARR